MRNYDTHYQSGNIAAGIAKAASTQNPEALGQAVTCKGASKLFTFTNHMFDYVTGCGNLHDGCVSCAWQTALYYDRIAIIHNQRALNNTINREHEDLDQIVPAPQGILSNLFVFE